MLLIFFLIPFILSAIIVKAIIPIAKKCGIVDEPTLLRKVHEKPIPLMGGVAIYFSLLISFLIWYFISKYFILSSDNIFGKNLNLYSVIFVFIAMGVLLVGGIIDDKFNLKPWKQILFAIIAVLIAIIGGITISKITNPFGGAILLDWKSFIFAGKVFAWPATLITFFWLLGMTYTTKILDGLDGLATGIAGIGALMIAALSLLTKWYQPDVGTLAIIFAGACAGFLIFNFNPAKIFLGESGSLILGFFLGVLAVISGSKIITTLLVIGLPIVDVAWTVIRRFISKKSIAAGDKLHTHHLLLGVGFSHKTAVIFLYSIAFLFGLAGIYLNSNTKLLALFILGVFSIILLFLLWVFRKNKA